MSAPPEASGALHTVATLGLVAASGLVATADALWVIADDGLLLHRLSHAGTPIAEHVLLPGRAALPTAPEPRKKAKPDLEALCALPDGRLLALGSGSRPQRRLGVLFEPQSQRVQPVDLAPLYQGLEAELPDLNIEGAATFGGELVLAHRGNSSGADDALLRLDLDGALAGLARGELGAQLLRALMPVTLGQLDGARLTLTDLACDADGRLCYSAAAERTDDRYEDGACAGSVIGRFDARFVAAQQWRLPGQLKIEGLANAGRGRWYLVADADDPDIRSPLLSLRLD